MLYFVETFICLLPLRLHSSCSLRSVVNNWQLGNNHCVFILPCRTAKAELERVSAEETSAREERNKFERSLTMVQHDMKENQRKLELEIEQRQKTEAKLSEVESQLQTEVSAHQAARGNSQQSIEKVQQLEKQVRSAILLSHFYRGILHTGTTTSACMVHL